MSEQLNNQTPPATSTETVTNSTPATPANTQSTPQADIAKTETAVDPTTIPSKDALLTKKEETPPPAETSASTEAPAEPFRPSYDGMIQGYIEGSLEEADYEAIEKSGLSRQQFELMANGVKALQEKNKAELHSYVGGAEAYEQLKEFGSINLSEEEIHGFNLAIASNQPRLAKMAVLGLKAMMEAEKGTKPNIRIEADGVSEGGIEKYNSQSELIKDMRNKKYGKDKTYTAEVDARRAKSGF